MGGGDQLLRIRSLGALETGCECIRRVFEHATLGRKGAAALFEISLPDCGCDAFHGTVVESKSLVHIAAVINFPLHKPEKLPRSTSRARTAGLLQRHRVNRSRCRS